MNPALSAAKTGLDAQQTRMAVISNNLANVNTSGFKKGRAVFEDLLYQNMRQVGASTSQDTQAPTGWSSAPVCASWPPKSSIPRAACRQTGNSLDLAIRAAVSSRFCCRTARSAIPAMAASRSTRRANW